MRMWPKAIPRHVTFHGLRHTTATLLLRAGVDPHRVQRILRHRDVRTTTKTYAHLLTEDLRGAVNLLPAAAPPSTVSAGETRAGAAEPARRVPDLSLHAHLVTGSGPTPGRKTKEVGPLDWRAIQDSNLWPSAPEAGFTHRQTGVVTSCWQCSRRVRGPGRPQQSTWDRPGPLHFGRVLDTPFQRTAWLLGCRSRGPSALARNERFRKKSSPHRRCIKGLAAPGSRYTSQPCLS